MGTFAHLMPASSSANAKTGWNYQGEASFGAFHGFGLDMLGGYQRNEDAWMPGTHYDTWRFLAGPSYGVHLGGRWALKTRALAGLVHFKEPEGYSVRSSFAWGGGLELRYKLVKHWFLLGSADFVQSRFRVPVISNEVPPVVSDRPFTFSSLNTAVGLGYTL